MSDVHVFHPKNDTLKVLDKLRKHLFRTDLDMIMLGGDFFDNLGSLAQVSVWPVFSFAAELLRHCHTNNIVLRILKGTPSHDWDQNRIFATMARVTNTSSIVRLIDNIEIEYIEKFDLHVLYIPDEIRPTTAITFDAVMTEMARMGLTQVDICLMHGAFAHQLPMAPPETLHCLEAYTRIVKYFISIGHIHQNSRHGIAIAQGSFDRNSHGDESPKGLHITTIDRQRQSWSTEFIENKEALIFRSIDLTGMEVEKALKKCVKLLAAVPEGSYVRFLAESTSAVYQSMAVLQSTFPQFRWTKKATDTAARKHAVEEFTSTFTAIQLTRENLGEMLTTRVLNKHAFTLTDTALSRVLNRHL